MISSELEELKKSQFATEEEMEKADIPVKPLNREEALGSIKSKKLRRFISNLLPDSAEAYLVSKTGTRVDTGAWFFNPRMWVIVTDQGLTLASRGKRRDYIKKFLYSEVHQALWNSITKKVVIEQQNSENPISLKMKKDDAKTLLSIFKGTNKCGK